MPIFAMVLVLLAAVGAATDWPQWRGPNRDGYAPSFRGPAAWPEKLTQRWKVTVGEGHSSPIFGDGRIYQFSRLDGNEVLQAIQPQNGSVIWKQSYAAPYTMNLAAFQHGKGPKSTPVYSDGRVFTLGISGILSAHQATDGRLLWRKDFGSRYKNTSPDFGTATSPVVWEGMVIAFVGGDSLGALTAFDAATGVEKWQWNGDGPGYASPVVGVFSGVPQVITQSQSNLVGINAQTGQLLWQTLFTTPHQQNASTPLIVNGTLIYSGLENGVKAVRPNIGDTFKWGLSAVWETKEAGFYMSTPVAVKGRLFGFSHRNKGQIVALSASTGATEWLGAPRLGDNAAIVAGAGVVMVLLNESDLIVLRNDATKYEPVRRYTVATSPTWAHPLPLDNGIVIKDANTLALWSW